MDKQPEKQDKETLINLVKHGIELLAERNISNVVILSSYKINSVLKDNYGVDIKVDRIGRVLSIVAKKNQLKRLSTQIPKYKLQISKVSALQYY
jgi:peroxiredoxin